MSGAVAQSSPAFVPPSNFMEFHERYMQKDYDYVEHFLRRRKIPFELMQDYRQDMCEWLLKPVEGSGKVDRIAYYNPAKQAGESSTQGHFLKWVKFIMTNRLINLEKSRKTEPVTSPNAFQFVSYDTHDRDQMYGLERVQASYTSEVTNQEAVDDFQSMERVLETRMEMDKFRLHLKQKSPDLVMVLDLMKEFDTLVEISEAAGITIKVASRWKKDLFQAFQDWKETR